MTDRRSTPLDASSPDPVAQAREYQQSLLAALGDDDPAEAAAETPGNIRQLIDDADDDLRVRPEPGEWSVLLCLAHIGDAEVVMSGRYRWVLAHERPELLGYDQDLWVDNLHTDDDDPVILLDQFTALRAANIALWRNASPAERARVGLHRERGEESFELMFKMLGGHDRVHLAQARRALDAVRARPS